MMKKKTVQIGQLKIGEGMPKICVPIMGKTRESILENTAYAMAAAPDLLEWRGDDFEEILVPGQAVAMLQEIRGQAGALPILFTFRSAAEGGQKAVSPQAYAALNEEIASSGLAELLDVEAMMEGLDAASLISSIQEKGKAVIASRHYFHETPDDGRLEELFRSMEQTGADILKLAVMPENVKDVLRLLQATQTMDAALAQPVVTMSMGAEGTISRCSGECFGSAITYACAGEPSAPGQLPAEEVRLIQEILHRRFAQ